MPTRATSALLRLNLIFLLLAIVVPLGLSGGERVPEEATAGDVGLPLHLRWVRELPVLTPAWPDQQRLQFDAAYVPVLFNHTLYLASSRTDSVTAYDPETGEERWRFLADGPVRFAPMGWRDRIFFVADDGHLYCLDAASGTLLWKFRGGPSGRRALGNERLISLWPARGAPVVADGVVYFAAGIWPFMGTFLHALDARTGRVIWTNDGDGSMYIKQPHQTDAFAGVAPQGQLAVADDRLLVPGGRSVPAVYDRHTGKLLHFRLADNSKRGGGPNVQLMGDLFFNGGAAFDLAKGDYLGSLGEPLVLADDLAYACEGSEARVYDLHGIRNPQAIDRHRIGKKIALRTWSPTRLATARTPLIETATRANNYLIAGNTGKVFALGLPLKDGPNSVLWEAPIQGRPAHLVAGDDYLFVSTREGRVFCFGKEKTAPLTYKQSPDKLEPTEADRASAAALLKATGVTAGYAVLWGVERAGLIAELARQSKLHVLAVEEDLQQLEAMRRELVDSGLYGTRVAVLSGEADQPNLPPYLASLILVEEFPQSRPDRDTFLGKLYESLRPYGGVLCMPAALVRLAAVKKLAAAWEGASVRTAGEWILVGREGPLPGAGEWAHEHADAANTRVSQDDRVKAPLGLLWFGGPSNDGILPRHGHGPQPQVIGGRMFIEGVDKLRAIDVYTGRLLWETNLPGVGKAYDNLAHQPGANAGSANFASAEDGLYVAYGKVCIRLDPATGKKNREYLLPANLSRDKTAYWSCIRLAGDYLIAGVAQAPSDTAKRRGPLSSSKYLVVLERASGKVLWTATARQAFRNNAICVGGGRVYAIDRLAIDLISFIKKSPPPGTEARLIAFDLVNGTEVWSSKKDVFGTWLSYSEKFAVLLEAGLVGRDTLFDEPRGVRAYDGAHGKVLWHMPGYNGPAMVHDDRVLIDNRACDLRTGALLTQTDPITGKASPWTWTRTYGCNIAMASRHLLTFRSGAAGYYDLCSEGGTGNFGGFRSGCTNNLVVAGGVLCAPDYTRTCTCSYQNQTSVGLVPMPDVEMWTFQGKKAIAGEIQRVGINLGAPGNRKSADGTWWLEYPSVGGPSPRLTIATVPEQPQWFRRHSSRVDGTLPWVAASGAKGLEKLTITLGDEKAEEATYTVRLHFAEPDGLEEGRRVFHVDLQGNRVLSEFDISREAGGSLKEIIKEFLGIPVRGTLTIGLMPATGDRTGATVLCGVEIRREPAR